jgi:hypothetical protein
MGRVLVLLVAFCLGLGVAAALPQRAKDATQVDPQVHHAVMENEHVRVLEVRAPVGYKSPMHFHPPLLGVSLGAARLRVTPRPRPGETAPWDRGNIFLPG